MLAPAATPAPADKGPAAGVYGPSQQVVGNPPGGGAAKALVAATAPEAQPDEAKRQAEQTARAESQKAIEDFVSRQREIRQNAPNAVGDQTLELPRPGESTPKAHTFKISNEKGSLKEAFSKRRPEVGDRVITPKGTTAKVTEIKPFKDNNGKDSGHQVTVISDTDGRASVIYADLPQELAAPGAEQKGAAPTTATAAPVASTPAQSAKAPEYHAGDPIELTGKTQTHAGGNFEEFRYLDGPKKGQIGVRSTKADKDANEAANKARHDDMQAAFKRLRESGQSDQSPKAKPTSATSGAPAPASTLAPTAAPASGYDEPAMQSQIAAHRSDAAAHEDEAIKHGKTVLAHQAAVGRGRAMTEADKSKAARAQEKRVNHHAAAAASHGKANELESQLRAAKDEAGDTGRRPAAIPETKAPERMSEKDALTERIKAMRERDARADRMTAAKPAAPKPTAEPTPEPVSSTSAPAAPSLREQAAKHREGKGDTAERLKSLGEKMHGHYMANLEEQSRVRKEKETAMREATQKHTRRAKPGGTYAYTTTSKQPSKKEETAIAGLRTRENELKARVDQRGKRFVQLNQNQPTPTPAATPASAPTPAAAPLNIPGIPPVREYPDLPAFASDVKAAASSVGPEGRFGDDKAYIADVHAAYEKTHGPMPIDLFKRKLFEANRSRHLDLSKANMVEAMLEHKVQGSEIAWGKDANGYGGSAFHFVHSPPGGPKRTQHERGEATIGASEWGSKIRRLLYAAGSGGNNCGDGSGGFQAGNKCGGGIGGSGQAQPQQAQQAQKPPSSPQGPPQPPAPPQLAAPGVMPPSPPPLTPRPQAPAPQSLTPAAASLNPSEGWKLHLGAPAQHHDAIENHLKGMQSRGEIAQYKRGRGAGQEGKDFTVYAGHRDKANAAAQQLHGAVGHLLAAPGSDVLTDDQRLAGNIHGRFDIGKSDTAYHQYGSKGIPYHAEDMNNLQFSPQSQRPALSDSARSRAHASLIKKYGQFYTGAAPELQAQQAPQSTAPDWVKSQMAAQVARPASVAPTSAPIPDWLRSQQMAAKRTQHERAEPAMSPSEWAARARRLLGRAVGQATVSA
jgi:hypothetical protein